LRSLNVGRKKKNAPPCEQTSKREGERGRKETGRQTSSGFGEERKKKKKKVHAI